MNALKSAGYAGDISPTEAWRMLSEDPAAQLIDVRTRAEWAYVGLPDLGSAGKQPGLVEWQVFPHMSVNAAFADQVDAELRGAGFGKDAPVVFLCRSGVRSRAAAQALTAQGYTHAYNIAGGFEGDPNEDGHRGQLNGWKAEGLPWRQG